MSKRPTSKVVVLPKWALPSTWARMYIPWRRIAGQGHRRWGEPSWFALQKGDFGWLEWWDPCGILLPLARKVPIFFVYLEGSTVFDQFPNLDIYSCFGGWRISCQCHRIICRSGLAAWVHHWCEGRVRIWKWDSKCGLWDLEVSWWVILKQILPSES